MPFVKGQSGNPLGKSKSKEVSDMLRLISKEIDPETNLPKLRLVCDAMFKNAIAGDNGAVREIFDRLEGKSIASVDITTRHADPRDIPDSELLDIATGSSNGASGETGSETEPNSVH